MAWRYKIMSADRFRQLVADYGKALFIEVTHQSKPGYHLMLNNPGQGPVTLGRVSRGLFKKLDPVKMENQPPYINVSYWKFKNPAEV